MKHSFDIPCALIHLVFLLGLKMTKRAAVQNWINILVNVTVIQDTCQYKLRMKLCENTARTLINVQK